MKKNLFIILLMFGHLQISFAQTPTTPIPGSYTQPDPVSLCSLNTQFNLRLLDLTPIGAPSSFTLSLQIFVTCSLPQQNTTPNSPPYPFIIPPFPWSNSQYPYCHDMQTGSGAYGIAVTNASISSCTLSQPPVWNSLNQTFDWEINSCAGVSVIESIVYDLFLDCSLKNTCPNGSALYLVQVWSYNGLPLPLQPAPVQIQFPNVIAAPPVTLPGNFNPAGSENWDFAYRNIGTSEANIIFNFSIDPCTGYDLSATGSVSYQTSATATPGASWTIYDPQQDNFASIPVNHFLIIRQVAEITGCINPCQGVEAHFNWKCDNRDPGSGNPISCVSACCDYCYKQDLTTEIHFLPEVPTFTITRNQPTNEIALHNTDCQGTTTQWQFTVQNTNAFTVLPEIEVKFTNGINNSLSIISEANILTPSCTNCSTAYVPLTYPQVLSDCSAGVSDPVSEFTVTIASVPPGGSAIIEFEEFHCCSNHENFFDTPKFFNQWKLTAQCTTACGQLSYPAAGTNYAAAPPDNISGYGTNPNKDVSLDMTFVNTNGHANVNPPFPGAPAPYPGADTPLDYQINIQGLFGNLDDLQALGYSANNPFTFSGIIKAEILIEDAGLLFANPNHAFFEITVPGNPNPIRWEHHSNWYCFPPSFLPCNFIDDEPCLYNANSEPLDCISNGTYQLYFDIADLINALGGSPQAAFNALNAAAVQPLPNFLTKFKFRFYPCCTAEATTGFEVRFSLLRNSAVCYSGFSPGNNCTDMQCLLPLNSVSGYTTVHCPGCVSPGIVVTDYRMERTTLGFPDANNNRYADNFTFIDYEPGLNPKTYSHYNELNLTSGVFGDSLTDFTIAYFQDGFYDCNQQTSLATGYTYDMLQNASNFDIDLSTLQVLRHIPHASANEFAVEVTGFSFYVDMPSGSSVCRDCNDFYTSANPQDETVLEISVDFNHPNINPNTIAQYFEWADFVPGNGQTLSDRMLLFTFTESGIQNIINDILNANPLPDGVTAWTNFNSLSPAFDFVEGQIYRLRTHYAITGNFHDPLPYDPSSDLDYWKKESAIMTYMFLTGSPRPMNYFVDNGSFIHNPMDPGVVAPCCLNEVYNEGFSFGSGITDPLCDCDSPPYDCNTQPSQANFGDAYLFMCEPTGAFFYFISTDLISDGEYKSFIYDQPTCRYFMQLHAGNTFRKLSRNATGQFFEYEFKPSNIRISELHFFPPAGWEFESTNGIVPVSMHFLDLDISNNTATSPITLQVTNANPLVVTIPATQNFTYPSVPLTTASNSWQAGDEYSSFIFSVPCRPSNNACPTPYPSAVQDSGRMIARYTSMAQSNPPHPLCALTHNPNNITQQNNNTAWALNTNALNGNPYSHKFNAHLPNLNAQFILINTPASTNTLTWSFSISNPVTAGNYITSAKNVYIRLPNVNWLSNWQINYQIASCLSSQWSCSNPPFNTPVIQPQTGNSGDFIWLVPVQCQPNNTPYDYLSPNGIITGTITASYNPCQITQPPATIQFDWGWNCTQPSFPTPPLCMMQSTTLSVSNELADLSPLPPPVLSQLFYEACGPDILVRACFKSTQSGHVRPTHAKLIPYGNVNAVIQNILPGIGNGNSSYSFTPISNTEINISVSNPGTNNYMEAADCFCIEYAVSPGCNFGPLQLPSVLVDWEDYCGNPHQKPFDITPAIPNFGTSCTDCFMVEKSASATQAAAGTEPVTYTITVSGNNLLAPTPINIDLNDIFPSCFTPDPNNNPFANGPYTFNANDLIPDPISITVTGTFNTPNSQCCNVAQIEFTDSQQNPQILYSDSACVVITDNCINSSTIAVNNQNATSAFSLLCTQTPCIISNQVINVTGTLTIDDDFIFTDCIFTMEPGSEIIIDQQKTVTFTRCDLGNCSKMWRGITLRDYAVCSIRTSDIHGAQYGVKVGNRNVLLVRGSNFYNNYIGIFMPDLTNVPVSTFNSSAVSVSSSLFYGTGGMPPVYQGQTDYLGFAVGNLPDKPYSGILAYRAASLFLGFNTQQPNEFFNMSNGIIGQRSNLSGIFNCRFEDIMPEQGYNYASQTASFNANYNGSAIYGNGYKTAFEIEQEGFGTATTDPATFTNCRYGIFADRIRLHSQNNKMEKMGTAYHARHIKSRVVIHSNNIDSHFDAIQLKDCDGSQQTTVWNNDIVFGDNDATKQYAAIRVEENQIYNPSSFIHYNRINFRQGAISARTGIHSNATTNFFVTQNEITMADNNYNHDGIFMTGCIKNNVSCNVVTGSLASDQPDYQSAITNEMGDSPIIGCNIVDQTNNGIFVIGPVSGLSDIKGNKMNHHYIAYRYSQAASVNMNNYRGNLWNHPSISPNGVSAKNENSNNPIFHFVENTSPPLFPFSQFPATFFQYFPSSSEDDFECDNPIVYCNEFPPDCPNCRTEMDDKIARNEIENDPFTEETEWMLKYGLYSKLLENPSLLADSLMNAFYISQQNTVIDQLKSISDGKAALFLTDSLIDSSIEQGITEIDFQFELLRVQVSLLDTLMFINDTPGIIACTAVIDGLQNNIIEGLATSDSIADYIMLLRIDKATDVNAVNAQVITGNSIEGNERIVNEIYLATMARDDFMFDAARTMQLHDIATQCPLTGGNAVFRARTLYSFINPYMYYNDIETCLLNGTPLRQVKPFEGKKMSIAHIFPNPAKDEASLVYDISEFEKITFDVVSTTGQNVISEELKGGKGTFTFSTASLQPAIYFYWLTCSGVRLMNGKLVIIK
jgi:hypothetical protein